MTTISKKKNLNNPLNLLERKKIGNTFHNAQTFFKHLIETTSEAIRFLCLDTEDEVTGRAWLRNEKEIQFFVEKHSGNSHVFFGAATRTKGGGKKKHCREVPWLWADIDYKDFADGETEARKLLADFKFQPSIVIFSGGGLHCYWVLENVLNAQTDQKKIERALKVFVKELKADPNRTDISSLLRVPGTVNIKPERKGAVCHIEFMDFNIKVTLDDILSLEKSTPNLQAKPTGKTLYDLKTAICLGNRDQGAFNYINAHLKTYGSETDDNQLEEEVHAILDEAGGDNVDVIKKKVSAWIKSGHEIFDRGKKLTTYELSQMVKKYYDEKVICTNNQLRAYSNGHWSVLEDNHIRKIISEIDAPNTKSARTTDALQILKDLTEESKISPQSNLLCLESGTLNVHTGDLLPNSPDHYLFNQLPIKWNTEAECPLLLLTLDEIFQDDPDKKQKILLLQELFGYCLLPETSHQKFFLFVGNGANGKSLILDVLSSIIGAGNISSAMLNRLNNPYNRAELHNKLINLSSEMKAEDTISDGYLKAIVSGDVIEARHIYGRPFSFRPYARLIGATNKLPNLLDTSHGFKRRAIILKFDRIFSEKEQDKKRLEKLKGELSGILRWAVQGYQRLQKNQEFTIPPSCKRELDEYMIDSDPVRQFVEEQFVHDKKGSITATPLYLIYAEWAKKRGFHKFNLINFGKKLKALGFKKRKTKGVEVWCLKFNSKFHDCNVTYDNNGNHSFSYFPCD